MKRAVVATVVLLTIAARKAPGIGAPLDVADHGAPELLPKVNQ